MKKTTFLFLVSFLFVFSFAQDDVHKEMKLYLQTDVTSYFTRGFYSIFLSCQKGLNQMQLSFENSPNAEKAYYYNYRIREDDKTIRLAVSRYIGFETWYKRIYYGLNFEYHWSDLEETVTRETQKSNNIRLGPIVGYCWYPWANKNNILQNIEILPWASCNYRINNRNQTTDFEITGNVYDNQKSFYNTYGINISYIIFKK